MKTKLGLVALVAAIFALVVGGLHWQANAAPPPSCNTTLTGHIKSDVTVGAGESCVLDGAHVDGTVTATGGAALYVVNDTHIDDQLNVTGTATVNVDDSHVTGNASFTGNSNVSLIDNHFGKRLSCSGNASLVKSGNNVTGTENCSS